MMCLIGAELQKIFQKKIVLVGILLVVVLNHMMYDGWMTHTESVMRKDGTYAEGAEAIALDQEIAQRYEGRLTDEKVKQILEEFALPEDFNGADYPVGYITRNNMYSSVMYFHDENGNYNGKTVKELYGEQGENLQAAYNKSWTSASYYLTYIFMLGIAYLLIVSVTPVFSDEYARGMDALILTSRYGKSKCAWAKVIAVFVYTLLLGVICILVNTLLFLADYGMEGWNGSLQFNYIGRFQYVPYEINFAQAGIYAAFLWMGASFLLAGVSLLVSAYCKSSFISLIICALFYTAPLFLNGQGQRESMLLSLFPIQQIQLHAPFEVSPVGGFPFQYMILIYGLLAAFICGFLAKRGFVRHQVSN